jgi:pyrroline-5-carboxylate reductase
MKITVIGTGNMGGAVARHLAKEHSLTLCNRSREKGEALASEIGALFVESPQEAVKGADWVVLAVKPKDLQEIGAQLKLTKNQILLSVLGGVTLDVLKKAFNKCIIVRLMPNTAVTTGRGIMGLSEDGTLETSKKEEITAAFSGVGHLFWIPDSKMNAFAAFAASSPAFVFVMMEAMMESGIFLGFSSAESREIVTAVFDGAVALMQGSSKHPADLKLQIASPAGTTIAGLRALEDSNVRKPIVDAVLATYNKGH